MAQDYHSAHLNSHGDRMRVISIADDSPQSLIAQVQDLESKRSKSQTVGWDSDFIAQLESFVSIIRLVAQGIPGIAGLINPLAFFIELASREQRMLKSIRDIFSQFKQALSRIEDYLEGFGNRTLPPQLQDSLVVYYAELIGQYQDAIRFLQGKKKLPFIPRASRIKGLTEKQDLALLEKRLLENRDFIYNELTSFRFQIHEERQEQDRALMRQLDAPREPTMTFSFSCTYFDHRRNPDFHFRDGILEELRAHLIPGHQPNEYRAASLHGLGGVGKTQIALEFAHRYSDKFEAVFWINAETETKLRESLYACARMVQNEAPATDEENFVLINKFRGFLKTPKANGKPARWLAIFDNVEDLQLIDKFWLEGSNGSMIVTTRDEEIAHAIGGLPKRIPLFTSDESLTFMLETNPCSDKLDNEEVDMARDIGNRTGHLPLALNYISAYARTTSSSYKSFIHHYRDFDTNLLFQGDKGKDLSYARSIRNTWTMTLTSIDVMARMLMETIALLDPDEIPTELFDPNNTNPESIFNGPAADFPNLLECLLDRFPNRQTFDTSFSALLAKGLVTKSPGSERLSCHRLIKEAVLQLMSEEDRELHFDWIVFSLNRCFPRGEGTVMSNNWDKCAVFHPQISMLLKTYNRFSSSLRPPILLCEVVRRCAWYLQETGNFQAAEEMLQDSVHILQKAVETRNHPGYFPPYIQRLTAELYCTYGSLEYEQNFPEHGRSWFQKADQHRMELIEAETVKPFDIRCMALVDGDISLTHLADGSPDLSIGTYSMVLDTLGVNYPDDRGTWAANLSIALRVKGDLEKSLHWCQKSSEWTRERHGEESLSMAIVYFNNACTLHSMKRDDEALVALEKCLRIRQEKSRMHRYLGFTQHKIGTIMQSRQDPELAKPFFRSAAQILEKCESCQGAAARSKHALLKLVQGTEEASTLAGEISQILERLEDTVDRDLWNEAYFDKFVLYCHR